MLLVLVLSSILRFSALQRAEIAEIVQRSSFSGAALSVSVLFNEPKLLKSSCFATIVAALAVSVLFNEPKLLKSSGTANRAGRGSAVSVLFNEPKLLKSSALVAGLSFQESFSALQRAEIAEITCTRLWMSG